MKGVFCEHGPRYLTLSDSGPLTGVRLAVKDIFQLKGEKNTAGSPEWFNTHPPANKTALSLQQLLEAGSTFTGFTHLDELAYSMQGSNLHYGSADNPKLPGYFCGGSSMGSAAAVASGTADIGLGTDTGGSVRVPASYCGLFGIRTSHSLIPTDGVIGLAPCFDTVGWFSQTPSLLVDVGKILIPSQHLSTNKVTHLVICPEISQLADTPIQAAIQEFIPTLNNQFPICEIKHLPDIELLGELANVFRILQGRAIANTHGDWLRKYRPVFSKDIATRITMALSITDDEISWANEKRQQWCKLMETLLPDNSSVLLVPTTPTTAIKKGTDSESSKVQTNRQRLLGLTAIAGLWGAPQCHLPLFSIVENGINTGGKEIEKPSGFSLIMTPRSDFSLLALVEQLTKSLEGIAGSTQGAT
ncbi:amidase [Microbulbifer sp. A4B17]|uniref:amidase family protein n=1 Tax=Microbulbifer sp. A4B17 TaxID=359370 RepID=UPI000D52D6F0|nr:amidase family protein [Microbulbifer sp. A4B17]AWF80057.1 amidase [Microbulbifer sp. A4B17]